MCCQWYRIWSWGHLTGLYPWGMQDWWTGWLYSVSKSTQWWIICPLLEVWDNTAESSWAIICSASSCSSPPFNRFWAWSYSASTTPFQFLIYWSPHSDCMASLSSWPAAFLFLIWVLPSCFQNFEQESLLQWTCFRLGNASSAWRSCMHSSVKSGHQWSKGMCCFFLYNYWWDCPSSGWNRNCLQFLTSWESQFNLLWSSWPYSFDWHQGWWSWALCAFTWL